MPKLTVGLVGAGMISADHATSLSLIRDVGQLTIYDIAPDRASAVAAKHGAGTAPSLDILIDNCDLIWIATPPAFHKPVVAAACNRGKAIFCEKPLAHTATDARAIARLVKAAGVPFFMGHSGRWGRPFQNMIRLVANGTLGEPTLVWSTRRGYLERSSPAAAPWRFTDTDSGGVIVELGVHEIDFIQWAGGDWQSAAALGTSKTLAPGKYQDSVVALGQLAGGAAAQLNLSWADPHYLWQRGISGTEGSLSWCDSAYSDIVHHRPGKAPRIVKSGDWRHPKTGENLSIREQNRGVVRSLINGQDFPITIDDGVAAIEAATAIYKSTLSGRTTKPKQRS
jgi:UDP-N-acetylglucosamine 3-dehydrogenase